MGSGTPIVRAGQGRETGDRGVIRVRTAEVRSASPHAILPGDSRSSSTSPIHTPLSHPSDHLPVRMSHVKRVLRERAKETRCRMSPTMVARLSREIESRLLAEIDGESPVLVYASKPGEVDTHGLIASLLARGTGVVVPIIERETRTLRLSYLLDPAVLTAGTFSVPEPLGCEIPADPADISLVVVPMIAFDRRGFRLGYGAGYYDRFLASHPHIQKIGIAFSCLELPEVPADENDVPMDRIVTEEGVIIPG